MKWVGQSKGQLVGGENNIQNIPVALGKKLLIPNLSEVVDYDSQALYFETETEETHDD